jgi:oxalate decarboxylase/phosphoglucose isomerase-like protein (cupin superfamily)
MLKKLKNFKDYTAEGELVVDHEDYKIWDNTDLKNFTISNVILKAGKKTYSHSHPFNDEIYIFHSGTGHMTIKDNESGSQKQIDVTKGSIIPINGHWEHQTFNTGESDMHFTMIYDNIGEPTEDIKEGK